MLTFKRHRFAALAAVVLVALILALTTGSSMTTEAARTIDNTKEGQTGPGYVINARLNVAAADAQNLRDGNMLAGGLLQQSVQRQMEKEEMLRLRTEENKKLLEEQAKRDARAAINCSDEDYNTLLRIVQAEAGVCDEKGKILVANVIINRVKSPVSPTPSGEWSTRPTSFRRCPTGASTGCGSPRRPSTAWTGPLPGRITPRERCFS